MTHTDDVPGQLLLDYIQQTEELASAYGKLLLERNELAQENEALRKEIRTLKDTLDESATNGGVWAV